MPASAVDTFLSTVVSKTVPLLQNKQLNYKQNDIRLAKFRENIRQTLQKNVLLGSPEQTPTNLQTELRTVKIFVLFCKFRNGEGFCNKRNIRHVKQNCCRQAVALKNHTHKTVLYPALSLNVFVRQALSTKDLPYRQNFT